MPRMHILNTLEREAFDSPPMFTSLQRRQHFDFPVELLQIVGSFRTPANQVCFLVGPNPTLVSPAANAYVTLYPCTAHAFSAAAR